MIHHTAFKKTYAVALALSIICCVSPLAFLTSSVSNDYHQEVTQEDLKELAKKISVMVNDARAEHGLEPLYVVPYLSDCSHVRVREAVHKFSHYRPTQEELSGITSDEEKGEWFSTVIDSNLAPYLTVEENLAASEDPCSAEQAFYQWQISTDGHWEAILNPEMTHMGVAVTYEHKDRNSATYRDDPYEWYWELLMINVQKDFYVVDDPDNPGMKKRVFVDKELNGQYLPVQYEIVPKSTGDLSGDGVVDSYDYITILQYIVYQEELKKAQSGQPVDEAILAKPKKLNDLQLEAADCFKDGTINYNDAKALQRYVLGEYKSLPYVF